MERYRGGREGRDKWNRREGKGRGWGEKREERNKNMRRRGENKEEGGKTKEEEDG